MKFQQIPILTISLVIIIFCLHWLVDDKSQLYFSAADILLGEYWRIISGHFMHADGQHLFWNSLGLIVLGGLLEYRSRTLLLAIIATGIVSVSALLLTPYAELDYYCGLSGVLNSLLLVALWFEWRSTRSLLILLIACGSIAKVIIEVSQGTSVMTHISWPPFAWSHVAGLLGGLFIIFALAVTDDRLLRQI